MKTQARMKYINLIILFLLSCSDEKTRDLEFASFKLFTSYKGDSLEKEYNKIYTRQNLSYFDSTWKTENILDSIYFLESNPIEKSYFKSIDTLNFQVGNQEEKVIVKNQNKHHYELREKNNTISFKKITYSIPSLGEEIPPPPDSIQTYNNFDDRIYTIDSKEYKIYSFGHLGMCDDCDEVIYFSKEFGEIASYSIDWGNLIIIDSIANTKKLETIRKVIEKLKSDDQFFPNPKSFQKLKIN